MSEQIIEFTVAGSPRVVSRAIEQYATGHGSLHAIVVPWESDDVTLNMAVTSAKAKVGHRTHGPGDNPIDQPGKRLDPRDIRGSRSRTTRRRRN